MAISIRRIARLIACTAFALFAAIGVSTAMAQDWARDMFDRSKWSPPATADRSDEVSHDFGTVARGAKVEHRFTFENIFLEDAHIESAHASCGCTTPEVPTEVIKTWHKASVIAHVDTVNFQGQKDVTITVKFDKPYESEVQLSIHCYIRTDVVLEPGSVNLRTSQGSGVQQKVSVRYAGRSDWRIDRIESANPAIHGEVSEVSRGNGMVAYELTVNLDKNAKPGYSRDELELITNDPNPRAQRVPVPVEAFVLAPVTVHPSPLIMGTVEAGKLESPVMRPLVVRGASPFQITSVESSDPHFQCDVPTTTGIIQRVPVNFIGSDTPGKYSTRIRIHTTASTEPVEADVSIDLTPPSGSVAEPSRLNDKAVDPIFGGSSTASRPSTRQQL